MANRFISLHHELNEKLKLEDNASGLIVKLLNDYYKDSTLNETKINIKKETLNNELKLLETKKQEIISEEEKQRRIDEIDMNEMLKEWFILKEEKPTIIELSEFMKHNQIPKVEDYVELLKKWDYLHQD